MVEDKKKKRYDGGSLVDPRYLLIGIVVLLLAAGIFYVLQGGQSPNAPPLLPLSQLDTPMANALLFAYERGGELETYHLEYETDDNGVRTRFDIRSDGERKSVLLSGDFGVMEGYFGKNKSSDYVCLVYEGEKKCGRVANGTESGGIAGVLESYIPDRRLYLAQKEYIQKLIGAGVVVFVEDMPEETAGGFETKKITYALNYKNLTVDALLSLNVNPTSPEVISRTNQEVSMWVDEKNGLLVKSMASYNEGGKKFYYGVEYKTIDIGEQTLDGGQQGIVGADSFAKFYQDSVADYGVKQRCYAQTGYERDLCFKNRAFERRYLDACKLIGDTRMYEQCALIVAQDTRNWSVCETLDMYPDDCYIMVAGKTGDFELCKKLRNETMIGKCSDAAAEGLRVIDDEKEHERHLAARKNCVEDLDCVVVGNSNQYCLPKNTSVGFVDGNSPLFSCLAGVPCGCESGFCEFKKNDTYYQCISGIEEIFTREYILSLTTQNANETIETD